MAYVLYKLQSNVEEPLAAYEDFEDLNKDIFYLRRMGTLVTSRRIPNIFTPTSENEFVFVLYEDLNYIYVHGVYVNWEEVKKQLNQILSNGAKGFWFRVPYFPKGNGFYLGN